MRTPSVSLFVIASLSLVAPTLAIGTGGKVLDIDQVLAARAPAPVHAKRSLSEEPSKMVMLRKRKVTPDADSSSDHDYLKQRRSSDEGVEQKKFGRREQQGKRRIDARDHGSAAAHGEFHKRLLNIGNLGNLGNTGSNSNGNKGIDLGLNVNLKPVVVPVLKTTNSILNHTVTGVNEVVGTTEKTAAKDVGTAESLVVKLLSNSKTTSTASSSSSSSSAAPAATSSSATSTSSTATLRTVLAHVNKILGDTTTGVNKLLASVEKTGSADLLDLDHLLSTVRKRSTKKLTLNQLLQQVNSALTNTVGGANSIISTTEGTAGLDVLDVEGLLTHLARRSPKVTLTTLLNHVNAALYDTTAGANSIVSTVEKTGGKDLGDVESLLLHVAKRADEADEPFTVTDLLEALKKRLNISAEEEQMEVEKRSYTKEDIFQLIEGRDVASVEDLLRLL